MSISNSETEWRSSHSSCAPLPLIRVHRVTTLLRPLTVSRKQNYSHEILCQPSNHDKTPTQEYGFHNSAAMFSASWFRRNSNSSKVATIKAETINSNEKLLQKVWRNQPRLQLPKQKHQTKKRRSLSKEFGQRQMVDLVLPIGGSRKVFEYSSSIILRCTAPKTPTVKNHHP